MRGKNMGLLHIYCGDGKGKTTAAVGLAVRACGAGLKTEFVQFMKGGETSELEALKRIDGLNITRCDRNYGFTFTMTEQDKSDITECHNKLLSAFDRGADVVILDEFSSAYNYELIDRELAERKVFEGLKTAEVVITGRDPDEKFLAAADYISEIKCVRHPYEKGINARKGIEF